MIYMNKKYIAKGRRGEIWLDESGEKPIATKKALDDTKIWSIHREIQILRYLNEKWCDFVPQLISTTHDSFSYIYIYGDHYQDIYQKLIRKKSLQANLHALLTSLLERAYQLDVYGVVHGEFMRPYKNMIVWDDSKWVCVVSIIDFERGTLQDTSGKNMRQLAQRLLVEGYIDVEVVKWLWRLSCDDIYSVLQHYLTLYFSQKFSNLKSE